MTFGTTCLVKMAVRVSLSAKIACSLSSGILAKALLVGANTVIPSVTKRVLIYELANEIHSLDLITSCRKGIGQPSLFNGSQEGAELRIAGNYSPNIITLFD